MLKRFLSLLFVASMTHIGLYAQSHLDVRVQEVPLPNEQQSIHQQERTLSIIKPDAVQKNSIGDIISRFEHAGLHVVGIKMLQLNKDQAGKFYQEHKDRPFYPKLVEFMSSGPVVVLVLEGDQAVAKNRQLMGATDPAKAEKGTLRADFAQSMTYNAVHGSDSPESSKREILFFFQPNEIFSH